VKFAEKAFTDWQDDRKQPTEPASQRKNPCGATEQNTPRLE